MSDISEAAVKRLRQESPVVDAVCRQLELQAGSAEAVLVVEFTEIFLSKFPPALLEERRVDALPHTVLGAFRFLERSRPGHVEVEVVNPDPEGEGWSAPVTVIRTRVSERPFIVDTIREFLHAHDLPIEHNIYPVMGVERDEAGRIVGIRPSREGGTRESLVHCEVTLVSDASQRAYLSEELERWLGDVVRATDDFRPMVHALDHVVGELEELAEQLPHHRKELEESRAFLGWLKEGAFVFLGSRGYDLVETPFGEQAILVEPGSGLGILRNEGESSFAQAVPLRNVDESLRELVEGGPHLIISKTNAKATVHRRARIDYVGVKKLDERGEVRGEHRFIGLFTSQAYAEAAERIPILREKLQRILEDAGVSEGSHDYKEIYTIFNSMPKEDLFVTSAEEIGIDVRTVLTSYHSVDVPCHPEAGSPP